MDSYQKKSLISWSFKAFDFFSDISSWKSSTRANIYIDMVSTYSLSNYIPFVLNYSSEKSLLTLIVL